MKLSLQKKRPHKFTEWMCVGFLFVLVCGTGCQLNVTGPHKTPGPTPQSPIGSDGSWSFADGEGAHTQIDYIAVQPPSFGVDARIFALGHFRYIAHFGEITIKSKGASGAFLAQIDASGKFVWVKAFSSDEDSSVTPGGLSLDSKGAPIIALNVRGERLWLEDKAIETAWGVWLVGYDAEGKWLRQKQFDRMNAVSGLKAHRDGSVVMRCMARGGIIEFGRTKISSITRMETAFLARLDAAWAPQWALHISSNYNNTFQEHMHFAIDPTGTTWFAGEIEGAFPDLKDQLPAGFAGGSFLFKLDDDGKPAWLATGSSITGHGKRFSNQLIRHLSIDDKGLVHLLGISQFKGTFGKKDIEETGIFHFVFDTSGEWQQAYVQDEATVPASGLLQHFALAPDGRVFAWGRSSNLTFPLPDGAKISPAEPDIRLVWEPSAKKMTWQKETRDTPLQFVQIASNNALIEAGTLQESVTADNAMPQTGTNLFIDKKDMESKRIWRAQSQGKATLLPLQVHILKDGSTLALVESNGRINTSDTNAPETQRYLIRLDSKGKLLSQQPFAATALVLMANEQLVYHLQLSKPQAFETGAGKIVIQDKHLAIVFADVQGKTTKVVGLPASNLKVNRLHITADDTIVLAGTWNKGKGLLGTHTSGINIDSNKAKGFVAQFSSTGEQRWVTDMDVDAVSLNFTNVTTTSQGNTYLFGVMYQGKLEKSIQFGTKSIDVKTPGSGIYVYATISPDGQLLSANNANETLCRWRTLQVTSADKESVIVSGQCSEPGTGGILIAKIESDGSIAWKKQLASKNWLRHTGTIVDPKGGIHLSGDFAKTLEVDEKTVTSKGKKDIYLLTLTSEGKLLHLLAFGSEEEEQADGFALLNDRVSFAGTTRASFALGEAKLTKGNSGLRMFLLNTPLASILPAP